MRQLYRSNGPGKVFENIAKKKKFYQYSIGGHFFVYNFCCKMETVDFFKRKIRHICQNYPKTAASKLKVPEKRQISTFYLNSFCVDLIMPIWIKFVKYDILYFEFEFFFHFQPLLALKLKMPPRMKIIIFEFLVLINFFFAELKSFCKISRMAQNP